MAHGTSSVIQCIYPTKLSDQNQGSCGGEKLPRDTDRGSTGSSFDGGGRLRSGEAIPPSKVTFSTPYCFSLSRLSMEPPRQRTARFSSSSPKRIYGGGMVTDHGSPFLFDSHRPGSPEVLFRRAFAVLWAAAAKRFSDRKLGFHRNRFCFGLVNPGRFCLDGWFGLVYVDWALRGFIWA
ncbi:unnamed protein product [Arabidopsis arenosa]|uniref:Uncharacterized protein n=1 Tax=Arabidopsis arenosa TaxID=38785 RepID=A0A8S1ZF67_ARAAE|nr:unnamed protein product [Arabidopsis arenosa]